MTTPGIVDNPFIVLKRHGVPFVVIGGYAVNFHGHLRATEDFDIVWQRSAESERQMLAALVELDAKYIGDEIDPATGIERLHPVTPGYLAVHHLLMLWTRFGYLDLFDFIPAHPASDVEELLTTAVENDGLKFASKSWLIAMKSSTDRTKDREDVAALQAI